MEAFSLGMPQERKKAICVKTISLAKSKDSLFYMTHKYKRSNKPLLEIFLKMRKIK